VILALAGALSSCLLVPSSAPPQLGMITGVVTDGAGNPIVGADIEYGRLDGQIIPGTGLGTDQVGRYRSRALQIGGYRVEVSADGWISQTRDVVVQEDNPTVLNFVLVPSGS
jgi:hypothetical protein